MWSRLAALSGRLLSPCVSKRCAAIQQRARIVCYLSTHARSIYPLFLNFVTRRQAAAVPVLRERIRRGRSRGVERFWGGRFGRLGRRGRGRKRSGSVTDEYGDRPGVIASVFCSGGEEVQLAVPLPLRCTSMWFDCVSVGSVPCVCRGVVPCFVDRRLLQHVEHGGPLPFRSLLPSATRVAR